MEARLGSRAIVGFTINQFVRFDAAIGSEIILGLRWTDDFGPVVTLGAGGIYTEFLAAHFKPGCEIGVFSPAVTTDADIEDAIGRLAIGRLATTPLRGLAPRIDTAALVSAVRRFMVLAAEFAPDAIVECEINPLVITGGRLVALDILVTLGSGARPARPARPLGKLRHLLEPTSAAIIGVSETAQPRSHHPEQPDPRGIRPRPDLGGEAGQPRNSPDAGACRTSGRCPRRWTSSSWLSRPPRRRRPSPTSSKARRQRASS